MATAVSTKPMAHPGKMKRPPPPAFVQSGANGSRPAQTSSSPISTSMSRAGAIKPFSTFSSSGTAVNGTGGRPVAKVNGDTSQRPQDPSSRLQRPSTRRHAMGNGSADGRQAKKLVEPYGGDPYICLRSSVIQFCLLSLLTSGLSAECSQNYFLHLEEICKVPAFFDHSPSPNSFSIR